MFFCIKSLEHTQLWRFYEYVVSLAYFLFFIEMFDFMSNEENQNKHDNEVLLDYDGIYIEHIKLEHDNNDVWF